MRYLPTPATIDILSSPCSVLKAEDKRRGMSRTCRLPTFNITVLANNPVKASLHDCSHAGVDQGKGVGCGLRLWWLDLKLHQGGCDFFQTRRVLVGLLAGRLNLSVYGDSGLFDVA